MSARSGERGSRAREPRDFRLVLADPRWGAAGRDRLLKWPVLPGRSQDGDRPAARPRALTAAIVDTAFTVDLAEAVAAPVTLRGFAAGAVLQTGPLAEHGTAAACLLAGTRWPEGCVPGARLLCAMTGAAGGGADGDAVAAALRWLAAEAVDVLVLPIGAGEAHPGVRAALGDMLSRPGGPVVVAALGNVFPEEGLFPARLAGVWGVAAADDDGRLLDDAARSPAPDLVAPGDRILVRTGVYKWAAASGSSVACAVAAGAALRLLALCPDMGPGPRLLEALGCSSPL